MSIFDLVPAPATVVATTTAVAAATSGGAAATGGGGRAASKVKGSSTYIGGIREPFMITNEVREHLLMSFEDLMKQFVEASAEVWPSCEVLARYKDEFLLGLAEVPDSVAEEFKLAYGRRKFIHDLILKFHATLCDFYTDISEGSPDGIFTNLDSDSEITRRMLAPLIELDVRTKYEAVHASIRETVWMYLQQLCQYSNMYVLCTKFPDNTMQSIFAMSRGLESKLKKGEMSMGDFNISSLRDIGKSIVDGMNEKSVENLTRALTSDGGLENMVMMMGSMVKNISGGAVNPDGLAEMMRG